MTGRGKRMFLSGHAISPEVTYHEWSEFGLQGSAWPDGKVVKQFRDSKIFNQNMLLGNYV